MRNSITSIRILLIILCLTAISLTLSPQAVKSQQANPLTLAQVLTGLQSQSADLTMAEKNEYITQEVQRRGVTFRLTTEIEKEMVQAGATRTLINAVRMKGPQNVPVPVPNSTPEPDKPDADFEKIWVEQNVEEEGVDGIRIFATFNVYNLKDVKSDIVYRFQKDGEFLKGKTTEYSTTDGTLSARRYLTPNYTATVYDKLSVFVPYTEFGLAAGTYDLKIDADVILRDGTNVKHLTLQDLRLVIPAVRERKGIGKFERLWVDYNVTRDGKPGMTIHVKMVVENLKGEDVYLQVLFDKADGTKLTSNNATYRNQSGQTAVYRLLRPAYEAASFNDVSVFIPYQEFNLPVGNYNLRMDVDLIYKDYSLVNHLTLYPFTYKKSR